jgi:hypothetical protein
MPEFFAGSSIVKADRITNTSDVADKAAIFLAIFNAGSEIFLGHCVRGLTPKVSRYCLASHTW